MSRKGQGKVKARPKQGQGEAEARSRIGQGKVKVRSRQCKHNIECDYNLMGFDTIEINLVLQISFHVNLMKTVVNSNKMMQKICF